MPPKRKPPPKRAKARPQVKVKVKRQPRMQKAPAKKVPKADPKLARLVRCVLDPFAGPLSAALIPGGPPSVAIARRQSTFMLTVTGSNTGTDVAVVWNGTRDPYMVTATGGNDWSAPTVSAFGRALDDPGNYSVPLNSLMRVVSSGTCVECTSNITDISGMVYQFRYDNDLSGSGAQISPAWGATSVHLDHAVAHQRLGTRKLCMVNPPQEDFVPVKSYPDTQWVTGLPDTTAQTVISRFFVMGIPVGKTLTFLVSLSQVVEYYHTLDKHFASTAQTHMMGPAVVGALKSALTAPMSQASVTGSPEQSNRIASALKSALGDAVAFGKLIVDNKQTISEAASMLQDGFSFLLG